jgi:hypothetical protein
MKVSWWFGVWIAAGALSIAAVEACSSSIATETGSAGTSSGGSSATSSSASTGGAGGAGGAGTSASSAASGTGGSPQLITCDVDIGSFSPTDGECDFLNQDCPSGETCYPQTFGGNTTTKCVKWSGVKQLGAPCESNSECKAGLFCGFFCSKPCCPSTNDPCPGTCNFNVPFEGGQYASICNLAPKCDLFTPNACQEGFECRFDYAQGVAICSARTGNTPAPTEGQYCKFLNDCSNNQVCINNACRYSCDQKKLGEMPELGGCPMDRVCMVYDPPVQGYETLGHCDPP